MSENNSGFENFVTTLESFKSLQSGISGSRIKKLTNFALENVELEEKMVSSIINYSKTCQDSHKLGALYIIDSIAKVYLEQARAHKQYIKSTAKPGTYAHAVYVLGEAIQDLLYDSISKSNAENTEKVRMLIDIWDRVGLFPKGHLNAIRAKCFAMGDYNSTSASLSNAFNKHKSDDAKITYAQDPQERCTQILNNLNDSSNLSSKNHTHLNVSIPAELTNSSVPSKQQDALVQLLITIQQQLKSASSTSSRRSSVIAPPPPSQVAHVTTEYGSRRLRERNEEDRHVSKRSYRSRSPPSGRRNSLNNRNQNVGHMNNNNNNNNYNINSDNFSTVIGMNNHHLYPNEMNIPSNSHYRVKNVGFDPSLPPDHVKVFSRTLFIGGVPMHMKEWELSNILKPFAEVQSVILNNQRKHAFVKVYSRQEAENVLMNFNRDGSYNLRTRWGVGFGPRDCCDYQNGISIIPLKRLTEADQKWAVSAQWGGTGGQELTTGLVFDEPDIIIGDGVSSKVISQRMPTDGTRNGPRSLKRNPMPLQSGSYATPPQQQQPPQMVQPQPYGSPNQLYGQLQPNMLPPQQQQQQSYYAMNGQQQVPPPPPPQQQVQQNVADPTAQLNSLMNMLNQQQQRS
ncbi:Nrd1 complex RNA-binding subunit NDAI_0F04010 [Naumovozyma dairenensis CBS 421]|uniref:Protein NRD1 n=1 Tax=Naumovozyma dairenensis (strain ATCC 10597 / BCRC 20456 / CBS 421 / NBRC 0211 / NRRL Y-12639) TaxID=1071378 RepID=G0WD58_NAUDC|nr:hypothetical protein NDAI_0F04010 [Naumovozyma dairenensis CBS 421]CCD25719.1 hypothetical protein NDAI_0F04010 [Naumovozyma dairenensis CBS 421]